MDPKGSKYKRPEIAIADAVDQFESRLGLMLNKTPMMLNKAPLSLSTPLSRAVAEFNQHRLAARQNVRDQADTTPAQPPDPGLPGTGEGIGKRSMEKTLNPKIFLN